jgi:hypothetical protein
MNQPIKRYLKRLMMEKNNQDKTNQYLEIAKKVLNMILPLFIKKGIDQVLMVVNAIIDYFTKRDSK